MTSSIQFSGTFIQSEGYFHSGQWQLPKPHSLVLSELQKGFPASGVMQAGARVPSLESEALGWIAAMWLCVVSGPQCDSEQGILGPWETHGKLVGRVRTVERLHSEASCQSIEVVEGLEGLRTGFSKHEEQMNRSTGEFSMH